MYSDDDDNDDDDNNNYKVIISPMTSMFTQYPNPLFHIFIYLFIYRSIDLPGHPFLYLYLYSIQPKQTKPHRGKSPQGHRQQICQRHRSFPRRSSHLRHPRSHRHLLLRIRSANLLRSQRHLRKRQEENHHPRTHHPCLTTTRSRSLSTADRGRV